MTPEEEARRWYPVVRSEELVPRHVAHAQLLGQELAVWRDDAGRANAWENRCPHRGVRLSIGINDGTELRCRYHGWRFASGTAQCTSIPAHPTQKPASTIKGRPFAVAENHGYVWVMLGVPGAEAAPSALPLALPASPAESRLDGKHVTTLRSIFVDAPASAVAAEMQASAANEPARVYWLQPVDAARTVIHAAVLDGPPRIPRLALLRHHHAALARIRDIAEARRGDGP